MRCSNCNAEIPDNSFKCNLCGQVYNYKDNICPNCHAIVKPGAAYCYVCGYNIAESRIQKDTISNGVLNNETTEKIKKATRIIPIIYGLTSVATTIFFVILIVVIYCVANGFLTLNNVISMIKYILLGIGIICLGIIAFNTIKNNNKKTLNIVLVIISIITIGVIVFVTKFSKISFVNFDQKDEININGQSFPSLYKVTKYNNTFLSLLIRNDHDEQLGKISYYLDINKSEIPTEDIKKYIKEIKKMGYVLCEELSEDSDVYIYNDKEKNMCKIIYINKSEITYVVGNGNYK